MRPNEDYVLNVLEDVGLVTRSQIENAKSRLNGAGTAIDVLVKDGVVSEADVSRSLAAQAHMDWVDLSTMVVPPEVINQIRAADGKLQSG
jgi:type IV pilus assembly protein PilB